MSADAKARLIRSLTSSIFDSRAVCPMPSGHRFLIHLVRLRCYVVAIQDSPRCKQDHELKTLRVNELEATAKSALMRR